MQSHNPETSNWETEDSHTPPPRFTSFMIKNLLPFGKSREKYWYGCSLVIDFVWLILFAVATYSIDDTCSNRIKVYGEVMFWSYLAFFFISCVIYIMLMASVPDSPFVFLIVGIILWAIMALVLLYMWLFELIVSADWGFSYTNEPAGCETIYYLIIVNLFWLTIPVAFRVIGPFAWYGWVWFTNDVLGLPKD